LHQKGWLACIFAQASYHALSVNEVGELMVWVLSFQKTFRFVHLCWCYEFAFKREA